MILKDLSNTLSVVEMLLMVVELMHELSVVGHLVVEELRVPVLMIPLLTDWVVDMELADSIHREEGHVFPDSEGRVVGWILLLEDNFVPKLLT